MMLHSLANTYELTFTVSHLDTGTERVAQKAKSMIYQGERVVAIEQVRSDDHVMWYRAIVQRGRA